MENKFEIQPRYMASGKSYWIYLHGVGIINGPYDTVEEAALDVPPSGDLQYPLKNLEEK
jgi:urocanate hydratase